MKAEVYFITENDEFIEKSFSTVKSAKEYIISEVERCRKVEKGCHY